MQLMCTKPIVISFTKAYTKWSVQNVSISNFSVAELPDPKKDNLDGDRIR